MDILGAFAQPIFELPKQNNSETFPQLLKEMYDEYISVIETVSKGTIAPKLQIEKERLKMFCKILIQSAETYYYGFPAKAYFEFDEAMLLIKQFLFPEKAGGKVFNIHEPYYRARPWKDISWSRNEMFHIPFEIREFANTQRFSVPGLPCLYLANSIYVCWEELQKPDINKLMVSRFKLENYKLNFLDISLTPKALEKMLTVITLKSESKKGQINSLDYWDFLTLYYVMIWPLIAACSIKVKKNGAFKPEYIFPQFLLQWVRLNNKIDGIKYFSIAANISPQSDLSISSSSNYAVPVKEIQNKGFCPSLTESFSLTEPISFNILSNTKPNFMEFDKEQFARVLYTLGHENIGRVLKIDDIDTIYWHTVYGRLETELSEMQFEKIAS